MVPTVKPGLNVFMGWCPEGMEVCSWKPARCRWTCFKDIWIVVVQVSRNWRRVRCWLHGKTDVKLSVLSVTAKQVHNFNIIWVVKILHEVGGMCVGSRWNSWLQVALWNHVWPSISISKFAIWSVFLLGMGLNFITSWSSRTPRHQRSKIWRLPTLKSFVTGPQPTNIHFFIGTVFF